MRLARADGALLAPDLRAARTPWARMRGLMGRTAIPGDGLLIEPADSIHTAFMRLPIDLLFLDARGRVLRACPDVPPWRLRFAPRGSARVLELPAGFIRRNGLAAGDALSLF